MAALKLEEKMKRMLLVMTLLSLITPSVALVEGNDTLPSGVYIGDPPQLLCPLTASLELGIPEVTPEEELPRVSADRVELLLRVSRELIEQGVTPRGLQLVQMHPPDSTSKYKVVAIRVESDAQDEELWHVYAGRELAAGVYDLAMERPGWRAGLSMGEYLLYFLGCPFAVDAVGGDGHRELQETTEPSP